MDSHYVSASSFSLSMGFFVAAAPPPERSWSISLPKVAAPDCWVCQLRAGGYSRKDPARKGEEGPAQLHLASFQPGLTDWHFQSREPGGRRRRRRIKKTNGAPGRSNIYDVWVLVQLEMMLMLMLHYKTCPADLLQCNSTFCLENRKLLILMLCIMN